MLRTVEIGTCVMVQGVFVRDLADGRIMVRVQDKMYIGRPVTDCAAA